MGIIARQSIKGTIANYIGVIIGFVTTFFILTKYLTQEEIGLTRVLVDAATLLSGLAQLGTNSSMIRFFPYFKDEKNKDHGIYFWSIIIPFIGFIIFLAALFLSKDWVISTFAEKSPLFVNYFYFVIPIAFFMLYTSVFEVNCTLLMRIAVPKMIREIGIRAMLLISYIVFGLNIISLDGLVICFCATYGIGALLNIFYLLSLNKVSFKPDWGHITKSIKRDFILYTTFVLTISLVSSVTPLLNSFFISAKMGLQYTGIFAISNYIATVIEIPSRSLGSITQPQISIAIKNNDTVTTNSLCKKVSLLQLFAGSFIFLLIWINIDFFFNLLPNGNIYIAGKWAVFFLAISRLINSSFNIGISSLTFSKYYFYTFPLSFILTVCAIFLNIKFIPTFGISGAAMATLISYIIYYAIALLLIKAKINLSLFSIGQLKTIIIILVALAINYLWVKFASILFLNMPFSTIINYSIDGILKTLFICAISFVVFYHWHISEEVNKLTVKTLQKIGFKNITIFKNKH